MRITESYNRVHYALRPAKQVERRILIDALLLISDSGFPIRDYRYTGMGSIHFVDFSLFHKIIGIRNMLSVEISTKIENRIHFNAPYKEIINLEVGQPIGNFIPKLESDRQHLLWLDYDDILREEMLRDISAAASTLSPGSILLFTIDSEPPIKGNNREENNEENISKSKKYFTSFADTYLLPYTNEDFYYENLPRLNIKACLNSIKAGLAGRQDIQFQPLFNFIYADGHRMITAGGMICDKKSKQKIKGSRLLKADYIRADFQSDPFYIRVPILTRKEQLVLDSHMPCHDGWLPKEFEMSSEEIQNYNKIYRFFPSYAEILF